MSSKAKSGAKRKEEGAATDPKRVRSEEEAVGAVLDLAVEQSRRVRPPRARGGRMPA